MIETPSPDPDSAQIRYYADILKLMVLLSPDEQHKVRYESVQAALNAVDATPEQIYQEVSNNRPTTLLQAFAEAMGVAL